MNESVDHYRELIKEALTPAEQQCLAGQLQEAPEVDPEKPLIEFFVKHEHRSLLKLAPPVPAAKFYPKWLRNLDTHYERKSDFITFPPELKLRSNATVKACPGITDYLGSGYVMPLWSDFAITFKGNDGFSWQCPNPEFNVTCHPREQYETMPNGGFPTEIKFDSPWYLRTPPGYSVRLFPMFYHFEHLWDVMPGLVHTDQCHDTHINTLFHISEGQIVIPRGTPMMHVIPFKRTEYELDLHIATEKDLETVQMNRDRSLHWVKSADHYKCGRSGT